MNIKKVVHLVMVGVVFQNIPVEVLLMEDHLEMVLNEENYLVDNHLVVTHPMVIEAFLLVDPLVSLDLQDQLDLKDLRDMKNLSHHKDYNGFLVDDVMIQILPSIQGLDSSLTDFSQPMMHLLDAQQNNQSASHQQMQVNNTNQKVQIDVLRELTATNY